MAIWLNGVTLGSSLGNLFFSITRISLLKKRDDGSESRKNWNYTTLTHPNVVLKCILLTDITNKHSVSTLLWLRLPLILVGGGGGVLYSLDKWTISGWMLVGRFSTTFSHWGINLQELVWLHLQWLMDNNMCRLRWVWCNGNFILFPNLVYVFGEYRRRLRLRPTGIKIKYWGKIWGCWGGLTSV